MEYGVLCTQASGEQVLVTLDANDAEDAVDEVNAHIRLFYGPGDGAGRWLAGRNPRTITGVVEVRRLADWESPAKSPTRPE